VLRRFYLASLWHPSDLFCADTDPSRLPIAFYLKLFQDQIEAKERFVATSIMVISTLLSITGTVWAFLPKSLIGAEPTHA
jgi:hypothetical protein